jgi:tRNA1Val (adenine37-N6)-methyltransferase
MLAQRSDASVHSLDIDVQSCRQAETNYKNSPFGGRLTVERADFRVWDSCLKFDLLVSNPPYFSGSLKPADASRSAARHNDTLPLEDLVERSISLLAVRGRLAVILPVGHLERFNRFAVDGGLYPCRRTFVRSLPDRPPLRVLLEYSNYSVDLVEDILTIEDAPNVLSAAFSDLVRDFYLKL